MRKYYFKDASGQQQGPVKLDVLKTKHLNPETPIWYDPLPKWTTANDVDELKSFILRLSPVVIEEIKTPVIEIKEDPKPVLKVAEEGFAEKIVVTPVVPLSVTEPVVIEKQAEVITSEIPIPEKKIEATPVAATPVIIKAAEVIIPIAEAPAAKLPLTEKTTVSVSSTASVAAVSAISVAAPVTRPAIFSNQITKKKNTAWLSWVLSILVLGGAGYYTYLGVSESLSKNIAGSAEETKSAVTGEVPKTAVTPSNSNSTTPTNAAVSNSNNVPPVTEPVATTLTSTTTNTAKTEQEKKILLKKKADEDKKKQLAAQEEMAKQQADDQRKKEAAAQALLAKELQFRNGWSKYVTLGAFNYAPKGGNDGVNSFDIPVYNGTDAMIDRVVVKIDYYKKEGKEKSLHTETVIITNIPPKSGKSGVAPENKKARVAVGTITGVNSKKLHLCYPQNNGNGADPYYCN